MSENVILKSRSLGITTSAWNRMYGQLAERHQMIPILATTNAAANTERLMDRKFIMTVHREDWAAEWAARKTNGQAK